MEKLAEIRKQKNITQEELSRKSGVSIPTINRIETGKVRPHKMTLRVLAMALKVEVGELL